MPDRAVPDVAPEVTQSLRRRLLTWYRRHRRDLPWRSDGPDPYHVLVSEAMLQQTQVATVIGYFQRFLEAFPTVQALAAAEEEAVLRQWQGLGYYRRARHLHAAAQRIVRDHGGAVPDTAPILRTLPGVGRYTAGAVASIAFGRREPILDGNVMRVLARWFAVEEPVDVPATQARLWALAAHLVPADQPGDFNQALMELGALVCTPRAPACLTCPVAEHCAAHQRGLTEALPRRSPRRPPQAVTHHTVVLARRGRYLLSRRPMRGLWAGMWQFPTAEGLGPAASPEMVAAWIGEYLGLTVEGLAESEAFSHQTTYRSIRFIVWRADQVWGRLRRGAGQWRRLDQLDELPMANPQRRILSHVRRGQTPGRSP